MVKEGVNVEEIVVFGSYIKGKRGKEDVKK